MELQGIMLSDYTTSEVYQELPWLKTYFSDSDEKLYLDWRRSKGYTNEIEKLSRDSSDLTLTVTLKVGAQKKKRN